MVHVMGPRGASLPIDKQAPRGALCETRPQHRVLVQMCSAKEVWPMVPLWPEPKEWCCVQPLS